jgi:hypothetical protein
MDRLSKLDFDKPSRDLEESAKKFGLDLNDPLVKEELLKLKSQNMKEMKKISRCLET